MYLPKDVFENPENYIDFLKSKDFEGQYFDRKEVVIVENRINQSVRDVKEGIKECVSAFANYNQDGGLIVIGINDNTFQIIGLDHLNETQINHLFSVLQNELRNHATQIKSFTTKGDGEQYKTIYLLFTPYSDNAVCQTNEVNPKAWKRVGSQNLLLSEQDKEQIKRDKGITNWEAAISNQEYDEVFLDNRVMQDFRQSFLEKRDAEGIYSDFEVLQLAKAVKKHQNNWYWTNAGLLFFEKNPQGVLAQAKIRFLRFDTVLESEFNPEHIDFDRFFYGSLPTMIRNIRKFMREGAYFRSYVRRIDVGLQHIDEYPLDVIDELIVNAVIHRDYGVNTPIVVSLYKNAFVIENAGRILQAEAQVPSAFNLDNFSLQHYARNPILVDWFLLLRDEQNKSFVRALREGTTKIKAILKEKNYPSIQYFSNGTTKVILSAKDLL